MRTPTPSSAASPPCAPRLAISSRLNSSQPFQARVAARQSIPVTPRKVAAKIKAEVIMSNILPGGRGAPPADIRRRHAPFRRRWLRRSFVPQGEDRIGAGDLEGMAGDGADRDDPGEQPGGDDREPAEIGGGGETVS